MSEEKMTARESAAEYQRDFFDGKAENWRKDCLPTDADTDALLAVIPIKRGDRVLDVGCGAGVIDGALLRRGAVVDAIDLSPKMIERAKRGACGGSVDYSVADFYLYSGGPYDCIVVFDAYPHFTDKRSFAAKAAELLRRGGMLWIFFDDGKAGINNCHGKHDRRLSVELESAEKEAAAFAEGFDVMKLTDEPNSYYIGLVRR